MMKVVTVEQMRALERAANEQGLTYETMMENAGRAVADWLQGKGIVGKRVLVLVGPGNNGGDGLVAARYLCQAGAAVTVYCWMRETHEEQDWELAESAGVRMVLCERDPRLARLRRLASKTDWIVDSLLGTGVSRPIEGKLKQILGAVRRSVDKRRARRPPAALTTLVPAVRAVDTALPRVLAVDVPSGLNCDTGEVDPATLPADATVTLAFPKAGQFLFPGADYVGERIVADIGIPAKLSRDILVEVSTPELIRDWLPLRPREAHKGTFGKAMIIAGSANYTGAPYLAATAALRVGAGLVTLGVSEMLHPILAGKLTEATYWLLPHQMGALVPDAAQALGRKLKDYDALLVGPGIGRDKKTAEFVERLLGLRASEKAKHLGFLEPVRTGEDGRSSLPPLVIDADGLNALADIPRWAEHVRTPTVVTPHPGEMARLVGGSTAEVQADRIGAARRAAEEWGVVVVLKGAFTVISSPQGITYINPFANPALATAGTGDVLAGAIAGLLAQGLSALKAAVVGAYLHGLAGQMVSGELGAAGAVAGDLLPRLALSIRRVAVS